MIYRHPTNLQLRSLVIYLLAETLYYKNLKSINFFNQVDWGGGMFLNSFANPITPQATLDPELPVFLDSSLFPLPRSSYFEWTTTDLPIMEC